MEIFEALWYFDEEKSPICASFSDDADCERDLCCFSHDEPVFKAQVKVPVELFSDLKRVQEYLKVTYEKEMVNLMQFCSDDS
jgi:hypothetical protein